MAAILFGNNDHKGLEKEINEWCGSFIRYVAHFRLSCNNTFKRFMDFLTQWVKINFVSLKRVIYDDCKLIMYLTPLILDSDNIKIDG